VFAPEHVGFAIHQHDQVYRFEVQRVDIADVCFDVLTRQTQAGGPLSRIGDGGRAEIDTGAVVPETAEALEI